MLSKLRCNVFGTSSDGLEIAKVRHQAPKGLTALVSAVEYHNLATQIASSVWIAIDELVEHIADHPQTHLTGSTW